MDNLLEVRDLRVAFLLKNGLVQAVDGARLSIGRNETVVLAGESGSGKSVTALSLTRILPLSARIQAGEALFNGRDLLACSETELAQVRGRDVAYVFQEPAAYLNPVYTVGEQIIETVMLHQGKKRGEALHEAERLLGLVKIRDPGKALRTYPHQLSGGMNQRVFIAMAVACRPKLLIADEPTTSLDVTIEHEIVGLLTELQNELGFSLLFITHNLSIARRIAQRVYIMYQGKVVEEAATDTLFACPVHSHTKELLIAYEKIGRL